MKTLYESILTDIDDTLTDGDIAVERMGAFSERFKFIGVHFPKGTPEAASKGLNITVLRQLVKNIGFYRTANCRSRARAQPKGTNLLLL